MVLRKLKNNLILHSERDNNNILQASNVWAAARSMLSFGCLFHTMKTNFYVTSRIRKRIIYDDGRLFPVCCAGRWRPDGIRKCIVRCQSTQMQTMVPKSRPRASINNSTAEVEKIAEKKVSLRKPSVLEVDKHLLGKTLTELPLPVASPTSSHSVPPPKVLTPNSRESNSEPPAGKSGKGLDSLTEESWTFYPSVSDEVRWNRGVTHTYDASFMLTDIISDAFGIREDKSSIVHNSNFAQSNNTSSVSGFAQVRTLPLSDMPEYSRGNSLEHKSTSIKKKGKGTSTKKKKVVASLHQSKAKSEKIIQKGAASSSPKKTKSSKSKQIHSLLGSDPLEAMNQPQEQGHEAVGVSQAAAKSKKGIKKTKKNKKEEENKYFKEVRRKGREASFNQSLAAYMSVCINLGMLNRATHTLLYYRQCAKHSTKKDECQKVSSIQPYNIVLQGHAEKGNYRKMRELFRCLQEDGITPNEHTFISLLSCLGRHEASPSNRENIRNCVDTMEKEGIDVHSLFNKVDMLQDTHDYARKALSEFDPSFKPQAVEVTPKYRCNLVNRLNTSMDSTQIPSPAHGVVTQEQLDQWVEEQFEMEMKSELVINSIEKKEDSKDTHHYRKVLDVWEGKWRKILHQTFITQLGVLKKSFFGNRLDKRMTLYPYLVSLPPEDFICVMMQEIQRLARGSEGFSFTKYMMYRRLGELVYSRYLVKYKKEVGVLDKLKSVYRDYTSWYLDDVKEDGATYIPRVRWQQLASLHSSGPPLEYNPVEWPNTVLVSIGKFMYSMILLKVMLWNPLHSEKHVYPAIYEVERTKGYRVVDEIKPSPSLVELYQKAAKPTLTFESVVSPMVCPPLPWVSTRLGGYLLNNAKIVRLPYTAYQQRQRMEECGNQQLYPIMDSLNQLSTIPWRVNTPMLDIIMELFNNKGCEELDIAQPPSECPEPQKIHPGMTNLEIHKIRRQRLEYEQRKNEMHSLWCDALYKLSLANHFRDRVFWFPHNMDFRGRVYPCPPHLNHLSSDVFRSILHFAKGEKLGPDGLRWLKLHLINLTGLVKRKAVEERVQYCEEVMEDILDSADHPLTGRRWWANSDEPWQTLAACKELAAALRSGNTEEYVSHLPIHQDGSCNGLQHYAALGRDRIGAISVNLAPSREPQDVYSAVAALVERERVKDAAGGHKVAQVLEGHVKRKVIKQTVMTTVYGVTKYGARLQIEKQLKALDDFPSDQRWAASHYLVYKTFFCLEKMFTSTKEIQNWFTDCAKIVSETRGENLEYITPLGLPVVQPYSKFVGDQVSILKLPSSFCMDSFMKPNVMKQKNAFPPNFIHSLDSTHMMLTSLYCQHAGITFVSVHDCFWTHACSVNIMNKICREQFVALHKEPILEDLSKFLQMKFGLSHSDFAHDGSALDSSKMRLNNIVCKVPTKGEFDINNVVDSVYFFS